MGGLSHTVSGDIASFRTPSRVPIESLKFHFLPKQAGSEVPSPTNIRPITGWTGLNGRRSGRNLLNPFTNPIWVGWSTFYTINSDGSVTISDSDWRAWGGNDISPFLLPKGTYTLSWYGADRIQITTSDESYSNATLYYRSTTGGHVSFTLSSDGGVKFKLFGDYPITCTVQIEPGLIAHDYAPYSGEQIPITFPSNGKNLFDKNTLGIELQTHNLRLARNSGRGNPFLLRKGFTYTFSCNSATNPNEIRIMIPYTADTIVYTYASYITYTPSEDVYVGINFYWTNGRPEDATDFQIELGNAKTDYTPYSSDNTFYGGYIDPVAGEIVAEYYLARAKKSNFGNKSTPSGTGRDYRQTQSIFPKTASGVEWATARQQQKFNRGIIANPWSEASYGENIGVIATQDSVNPPITYMRISEEVYQAMNDDDYAEISYKLREPIHIPIPAQDLQAFLDHNNFWSDANGITEVTYAIAESKDILATRKKAMDFDHAHHKKVKWNNMAGAMNDQYWVRYNPNMIDVDFENNEALITVKSTSSMPFSVSIRTNGDPTVYSNHRYYVSYCLYPYFDNAYFGAEFGNNVYTGYFYFEKDKWSRFSYRSKAGGDGMGRMYIPYFKPGSYAIGDSVRIKNAYYIDLTLMFGEGNEPTTAEEFEHICEINGIDLTTYQPYDEGSDRWLIVP